MVQSRKVQSRKVQSRKVRSRKVLGKKCLDIIKFLRGKGLSISAIHKLLDLDISYRTAYNIIKADEKGINYITRPYWLEDYPEVQNSPRGYYLLRGYNDDSYWGKK